MNYKEWMPGREIVKKHGRPSVLQKLADFYKGMADKHPDLKRAADDFLSQHPQLK
jgi:hypothetical protein